MTYRKEKEEDIDSLLNIDDRSIDSLDFLCW